MTLGEAINTFDAFRDNSVNSDIKINILSSLDKQLKNEVIDTHCPKSGERNYSDFDGYTVNDSDTPLIAEDAFSMMYIYFLAYQCDLLFGDTERLANDLTLFNLEKDKYIKFYHSSHKSKTVKYITV